MTFNPLIAIPTYDGQICVGLAQALMQPFKAARPINVAFHQSSLLTKGFNSMWCEALNARDKRGITHFLMVHADIAPEVGFADILYDQMLDVGAQVISAISPMKSADGLTSTGRDLGDKIKRFTLSEIHAMPYPTFSSADLVVNTGLMLVDLRTDWAEKIVFHVDNSIRQDTDGRRYAISLSEDWHFSRQVRGFGGKIAATRSVRLEHMGSANYPNHAPWGRLKEDAGCEV